MSAFGGLWIRQPPQAASRHLLRWGNDAGHHSPVELFLPTYVGIFCPSGKKTQISRSRMSAFGGLWIRQPHLAAEKAALRAATFPRFSVFH